MYKDFHGLRGNGPFIVAARFRAVPLFNSGAIDYFFLAGGRSSFAAILTNSASDSACIFRITARDGSSR